MDGRSLRCCWLRDDRLERRVEARAEAVVEADWVEHRLVLAVAAEHLLAERDWERREDGDLVLSLLGCGGEGSERR